MKLFRRRTRITETEYYQREYGMYGCADEVTEPWPDEGDGYPPDGWRLQEW